MRQWRTITIFISSTFKDMDAERDYIKYHVIGRLNNRYNPRCLSCQVVDLRLGINNYDVSEEQREDRVLDICFDSIANSRPFFIGLVGNRYGWIPGEDRWAHIVDRMTDEERKLIYDGRGRSVTELEILFGAIGDTLQHLDKSLFFIRSERSYAGMSDAFKSDYCEVANKDLAEGPEAGRIRKLDELKAKIFTASASMTPEICFEYDATWDTAGGKFTGLEHFGQLLFDNLCRQIDAELEESDDGQQTWYLQEELNVNYLHSRNVYNKIARRELFEQLKTAYAAGESVLLNGESGCGKSILLSQFHNDICKNEHVICLSAFAGTTSFSNNMTPILVRWIAQLEHIRSMTPSDYDNLLNETPRVELYNRFNALVAAIEDKHVVIFIDGLEKMTRMSLEDCYLPWLTDKVQLFATSTADSASMNRVYNPQLEILEVGGLSYAESQELMALLTRLHMMELPPAIHAAVYGEGHLPLYLKLLFAVFTGFSADDFRRIRSHPGDDDVRAIHDFQLELFGRMPRNCVEMIPFFVDNLKRGLQNDSKTLLLSLQYIASAKGGLRESVLEQLLGKDWDTLNFHSLMYVLSDYVWENRADHSWKFFNEVFADAFRPKNGEQRDAVYKELIRVLFTLPEQDSLRNDFLAYYLFAVRDHEGILEHLAPSVTDKQQGAVLTDRYTLSLPSILNECDIEQTVSDIVAHYTPQERVAFANSLLMYGTRSLRLSDAKVWINLGRNILNGIVIDDLPLDRAYDIALIYSDMFLVSKHWSPSNDDEEQRKQQNLEFNSRAADGFLRCFDIDPKFRDCKNMATAMLSEQMEVCAMLGQFDKIEQLFTTITKLQTS